MYHQKPLIGIKGSLKTRKIEKEESPIHQVVEVVAEKVSSKKADE